MSYGPYVLACAEVYMVQQGTILLPRMVRRCSSR